MGLSKQVAYSSLLAFFPAVVLLVGLLGLFGGYDQLQTFLGAVAPNAVVDAIQIAQDSASGKGGSLVAVIVGGALAIWAASGAMNTIVKATNRAYERVETRPFYRLRAISIVLVLLTGLVTAGMFLLIVFGGPIGEAIAKRANLGERVHGRMGHPPLADRIRGDPAVLLARLLPRPELRAPQLEMGLTRFVPRRADVARPVGPLRALHRASRARTTGRTARSPARSCCSSGSTTRRSRCSSAPS